MTRAESANSKSRISCIHAKDVEVNELISSKKSPKSNRIQIESWHDGRIHTFESSGIDIEEFKEFEETHDVFSIQQNF
jgi:hypothetical protein